MNWEAIRQQLEHILDTPLQIKRISFEADHDLVAMFSESTLSITHNDEVLFFLDEDEAGVDVLAGNAALVAHSERQLIQMLLAANRSGEVNGDGLKSGSKQEQDAQLLRSWLQDRWQAGVTDQELPSTFAKHSKLFSEKIPLLLYGDYPDHKKVGFTELQKLLTSFFEVDVLLVPLRDKEWLILCSQSLLNDEENGEESLEEGLASICLGLYGMMASEGIGECHISIHYPIIPAKTLLATVIQLRETIDIGKIYNKGNNIHLPWQLQLERIVHMLSSEEKHKMLSTILKNTAEHLDPETLLTLEQFFAMDCNVSETAKKLYIHRNTLSYRLDRFKQETGLDVRTFNDAILARIGLLLYKVTNRM